jgi:hypothetical protein
MSDIASSRNLVYVMWDLFYIVGNRFLFTDISFWLGKLSKDCLLLLIIFFLVIFLRTFVILMLPLALYL